jgi:hypothetical protein
MEMNENNIQNIMGLTIDIKMKNSEQTITGVVYSIINGLIVILVKDESDVTVINSFIVNLNNIKEIKLSERKYDV